MGSARERVGRERAGRVRRRPPARRSGPPARRRRAFLTPGRAVLFGVIALLLGGVVSLFVPGLTPLVTAALAVASGALPLIADLVRVPLDRRTPGTTAGPLSAAVLVLLVVGGGTAYALSWTIDRVTGDEAVRVQRLVAQVEGAVGPLVVTVEAVEVTDNFTKVTFSAVNRSAMPAKVSVVDSCRLVAGDAEFRLDGLFDVVREPFFFDVPGGGSPVRRTFSFPGTPEPGATTVALTCGSVSWTGSDPRWSSRDFVDRPLRVADIALAPLG